MTSGIIYLFVAAVGCLMTALEIAKTSSLLEACSTAIGMFLMIEGACLFIISQLSQRAKRLKGPTGRSANDEV